MDHRVHDHHGFMDSSDKWPTHPSFGPILSRWCICGAAPNDPLHGAPPCDWCGDAAEMGAPGPWWHRLWCRFCAWLLLDKPKKEKMP